MAEFALNTVLIVALLALLIASAVNVSRRRRSDRRDRAAERRLIVAAFAGAAAAPPIPVGPTDDDEAIHAARSARLDTRPNSTAPQRLDAAALGALLDRLEDRRPARRGVIAGLVTSPLSVWSAGTRAGQTLGRRRIGQQQAGDSSEPDSALHR